MEYNDSKHLNFLSINDTLSKFYCVGTSQQNGWAEHTHIHILDSVWAMLICSSFPERFLGEASLIALYTINRFPSSVLGNMYPYERLYKVAPNYTLLKVFGSACFVLLQPHEHTKLEPHAQFFVLSTIWDRT